jgi:hypothetical protein
MNFDMDDEKYIKGIFDGIELDENLDLEEKIMIEVVRQKNHFQLSMRYKRLSKIGITISIILAILISYILISPIFTKDIEVPLNQTEILMPYLYSIFTLLAVYIQIEVFISICQALKKVD